MTKEINVQREKAYLLIWWIIWAAILAGLALLYALLGRGPVPPSPPADVLVNLAGMVPLFVSIVIRWLVLPRYTDERRALVVFIVGLALAETCGILGLVLGHQYRDDLFVLGVLGVAQYVPLFVKKLQEPKGSGFIPNN
jgi:F0F1-type ATP synthase membrane subunit c/vacuolar-type H+-ATPase subunit K